jgi:hypothetical protein
MEMNKDRRIAIIVGALILVAYGVLAGAMTESKTVVMFFEVISGGAVIAIPLLLLPFFKNQNRGIKISYLVLKIIEGALLIIAGILLITLEDKSMSIRDAVYVGQTYTFILSAFLFYLLLFGSKIIPSWISIWGIIAVVLLLVMNLLNITGEVIPIPVAALGYSQIMLNEIFLAVWLMVKGFQKRSDG